MQEEYKNKEVEPKKIWDYINRKNYYRNDTVGQLEVIKYITDNNVVVQPITKELLDSNIFL